MKPLLFALLFVGFYGCGSTTSTLVSTTQTDSTSYNFFKDKLAVPIGTDTLFSGSSKLLYDTTHSLRLSVITPNNAIKFMGKDNYPKLIFTPSADSILVWYSNIDTAGILFVDWLRQYHFGTETFTNRSGTKRAVIDRTNPKQSKLIFTQGEGDSIDYLRKEVSYYHSKEEKSNITTTPSIGIGEYIKIGSVGFVCGAVFIVILLIGFKIVKPF